MKTNTITAVPKLRFPEFQEEEGWERSEFNKVYDLKITNSLSRAKLNYVKGSVKNIHYGDIHTQFSALFDINKEEVPFINEEETNYKSETADFCIEGDIVIADASEDIKDIGKSIEIINIANQKIVCGLHTIHARPKKNKLYIGFGAYLFQSHFIRTQIQLESQGAKVLGLSKGRLDKINLLLPKTDEQRKIADCLSSLDTLIKSENEQLDTLKEYKAGLLQQLFPAEGETTPKLRFAEFEGDEDWEEVKLVDVAETSIGLVTTMTTSYVEKGIPLIRNSDIKPNAIRMTKLINLSKEFADKYENKKLLKNDIVTVHTGDIGVSAIVEQDLEGSLGFATLNTRVTSSNVSPEFVCWFFNSPEYKRFALSMATGDGRNNFNLRDFNKTILFIPDILEQQKIANCLSSLDNLIQAKDEKIKMLKEHKQGLMQQLFPTMDGE